MKNMKKLVSVLLTLVMALALTIPAFATNTTAHTITITNEKSGHTYTAYQVFAGDITGGKLTNIVWGAGVDGDALLTELKTPESSPYADCNSAEDVAAVLGGFSNDSAELDAFAKVVGKHLSAAAGSSTQAASPYTISVAGDGYYFVKDTGTIGDNDAATKYILQVLDNVKVEAKDEVPELDKIIIEADDGNDKGTSVDVGDSVKFQLNSKVPEMDGYDAYTYIVHDTMSNGLTFKNDVAVTIGGLEYTDFTVVQNGQSFTITFKNFISQKENAGKPIVITYTATLNEAALITDKETNTVNLEYSNDPNADTTSHTPDKTVYVYDFDIVIDKYTGDVATGDRLADAMFVLKNSEGKYYYWNDTNKKVEWKTVSESDEPVTTDKTPEEIKAAWEALNVTVVKTDSTGAASFWGLDAGTYALREIAAPAGYNLLKDDVTVEITASYGTDGQITSSSATSTNNGQYQQTQPVLNNAGLQLPSTGGIGTTIFYVLGSILVLGAGILLVTKKRMSSEK